MPISRVKINEPASSGKWPAAASRSRIAAQDRMGGAPFKNSDLTIRLYRAGSKQNLIMGSVNPVTRYVRYSSGRDAGPNRFFLKRVEGMPRIGKPPKGGHPVRSRQSSKSTLL